MSILRMIDLDLSGKRVLIREDLNVPLESGHITDDSRIRASLPGIRHALASGARLMLTSHLGRPEEGHYDAALSLAPVAARLGELLGVEVPLVRDWLDGVEVAPSKVVLLENCRFNKGEKKNSEELSRRLASLCDVYVNDAFATAHRAEATTHGVARFAPVACAGPLLAAELEALGRALRDPGRPLLAVVGGSKVSTKLSILDQLAEKVDLLVVGGGIANTFLLASGLPVGKSLVERDLVDEAARILARIRGRGGDLPLPVDVVCAKEFSATAAAVVKEVADVAEDDLILDIGPRSRQALETLVAQAKTVVWNGPVGVFELEPFAAGTRALAVAIAQSNAFTLAGGGDTLAALAKFGVTDRMSYVSTAGGAFLEFLEGRVLPAVEILEQRAAQ